MGGKDLNYKKIVRILKGNGFEPVQMGNTSHVKWRRGSETIIVSALGVNRMIWRRLCKEHGIKE